VTGRETKINEHGRSIKEDELHAYVDNQLDVARRPAVELYLDEHPDEARRVEAYRRQRAILRAMAGRYPPGSNWTGSRGR
jgi:anti-sigma factor RsiW